jgi:pimeloyl-ACP methyl ester carboxylesterase
LAPVPGGERAVLMSPERMKKFTGNQGLSLEQILRKDMDIYFSDKFIQGCPEKITEYIEISLRYYQPLDAFGRQFAACLKDNTVDRLNRVTLPTLTLSGDDDPLVPPENSKILNALIPRSELVFFPGKRHCFFIEEAETFNRKVISFLKSIKKE